MSTIFAIKFNDFQQHNLASRNWKASILLLRSVLHGYFLIENIIKHHSIAIKCNVFFMDFIIIFYISESKSYENT